MFIKRIIILLISFILYQSPLFSKSNTFNEFNSKNLSKYFSGIVAFENKNNSKALDFFESSKILINRHNQYLERYIVSLVHEDKVTKAINIIKTNSKNTSSDFFLAYILLALDSLKKNDIYKAQKILSKVPEKLQHDRFEFIILSSLQRYLYVFNFKTISKENKNFGDLSSITETFQRCYLNDENTDTYFSNLINLEKADYSRYIYFYLTYLVKQNRIVEAKKIIKDLEYIDIPLLLSQGKSWLENNKYNEFKKVFSCNNHSDIVGEFLFLVSNLYSSQNEFDKSNFYLNLSNYLNPKFVFNLSLVSENLYLNENYEKSKKILKKFDKSQDFYYWYKIKKEAQIISKTRNKKEALNYITLQFDKIKNPNIKFVFDIANFYKNSNEFDKAIKYYSRIINSLDDDNKVKADLLYRRGASFERLKDYKKADKDLKHSLKINPDDAYVLNYLAYSWLERNFKINEAIEMLEKAYSKKSNDPYIIDSIGWAYYLIDDLDKAENFLNRAVQLMPDDPIVNDHYGDILWKLDRKIQARYFWKTVLNMKDAEQKLKDSIKNKLLDGPKNS